MFFHVPDVGGSYVTEYVFVSITCLSIESLTIIVKIS